MLFLKQTLSGKTMQSLQIDFYANRGTTDILRRRLSVIATGDRSKDFFIIQINQHNFKDRPKCH